MITAKEATQASIKKLSEMSELLDAKLMTAINAAVEQGSCKATFYARSKFEAENAEKRLAHYGYEAKFIAAKDQRDSDRIEIQWGNV